MNKLELKIVSAEKILFEGYITVVKLPGTEGDFSLLPKHAALISSLKDGEIVYRTENGNSHNITIRGGFVEVNKNVVTVCIE